jgi:hypothetical protein
MHCLRVSDKKNWLLCIEASHGHEFFALDFGIAAKETKTRETQSAPELLHKILAARKSAQFYRQIADRRRDIDDHQLPVRHANHTP